jgi:hypothetical protein
MNIEKFVDEIEQVNNVGLQWQVIEKLAKENPTLLININHTIGKRIKNINKQWQLSACRERILESLCLTNGLVQLTSVLSIISNGLPEKEVRRAASMIAQCQRFDNISKAICNLDEESNMGYFVCLLAQELLIRKVDLSTSKDLKEVVESHTKKNDLFRQIPLHLTEIEKVFGLTVHGIGVSGGGTMFGLSTLTFTKIFPNDIEIQIQENDLIVTAVADWRNNSNGQLIGLSGTYQGSNLKASELIISLHNQYNSKKTDQLKIQPQHLEDVFSIIFSASANGGAYTAGEYGAFARLKTWQTLAAIGGLNLAEVACEDVITKLKQYEFYEFITNSNWFYDYILDLGILALDSRNNRYSILTATDTD